MNDDEGNHVDGMVGIKSILYKVALRPISLVAFLLVLVDRREED